MTVKATILTDSPIISVLSSQKLDWDGVHEMAQWVKSRNPECLGDVEDECPDLAAELFPHDLQDIVPTNILNGYPKRRELSDNELLVELCGRKCYNSFGLKAGKKTNAEYIQNTQQGQIPHRSIMYHAKMTFFFGGISRRVSHELIRNYVGSDRDEEGSPSQESTRYTHHSGYYVMHPRILNGNYSSHALADARARFNNLIQINYEDYCEYIKDEIEFYKVKNENKEPKGMDRKRIYEAASSLLIHSCETSFIWTSNPIALAKMIHERADDAADLEFQRFAKKLARICVQRWPNLFQQSYVMEAAQKCEG